MYARRNAITEEMIPEAKELVRKLREEFNGDSRVAAKNLNIPSPTVYSWFRGSYYPNLKRFNDLRKRYSY